jgi:hypothetical protein
VSEHSWEQAVSDFVSFFVVVDGQISLDCCCTPGEYRMWLLPLINHETRVTYLSSAIRVFFMASRHSLNWQVHNKGGIAGNCLTKLSPETIKLFIVIVSSSPIVS